MRPNYATDGDQIGHLPSARSGKLAQPRGEPYKDCLVTVFPVSAQLTNNVPGILLKLTGKGGTNLVNVDTWRRGELDIEVDFTSGPSQVEPIARAVIKAGLGSAGEAGQPTSSPAASSTRPPQLDSSPAPPSSELDPNTITLTPARSSDARTATITAPGHGLHNYTIFHIDAREFPQGHPLIIDVSIRPGSGTDGSFDLFSDGELTPTRDRPLREVAARDDVHKGSSSKLIYRFRTGQVFAFGLEGNWFSPKGATGEVEFQASVK